MRTIALTIALGVAAGCVEKTPPGKKIDPAYIEQNLLSEAPTMQNQVNSDLGGKVIYLGNDVDPVNLTPGGKVTVVHYWKVVEPPGADWKVFAHVNGAGGDWMNVDYTDMRVGYPVSKWKAGDIIRDEQKFELKKEWKSSFAQLSVGLYRKGGQGVGDRMPIVSGPKDNENRVLAFRFKVDAGAASGKEARYIVRKASGPITIDGKADEDAWKVAPKSPDFTTAEGGKDMGQATNARLLWDDQYLYAFIEAADSDVYSQYKNRDDTLWKEDVVELFIDADRNRKGYVELQVNPNNAHFDSWFPITRAQPHHFEWNGSMQSAVVVHGTNDNRDDTDEGWDVEIAIPMGDVKGMDAGMKVNIPPHVGDEWRLNVVRGDKAKGADNITASSWNPITIQDFHALGRMLTVQFADAEGGVTPPAPEVAPTEGQQTPPATEEGSESAQPAPVQPANKAPAPTRGGPTNNALQRRLDSVAPTK